MLSSTYIVRAGDSPAKIAANIAGCPKCAVDLIAANPHKPTRRLPNGFVTFRALVTGEHLKLPEKWIDGRLDDRPKAYFAALPYADGVTPSVLGDAASGVLGTYALLDQAIGSTGALAGLSNVDFGREIGSTVQLIDASVNEAYYGINKTAASISQNVITMTREALSYAAAMDQARVSGPPTAIATNRLAAQNALSTALGAAKIALEVYYSAAPASAPVLVTTAPVTTTTSAFSASLRAAATAAAAAIAADPQYCTSVKRNGSAVNTMVHAFKAAWNSSQPAPVPIGTGNYEQATADALARVLGRAPAACPARVLTTTSTRTTAPSSPYVAVVVPEKKELSTGSIVGWSLLGAGGLGSLVYYFGPKLLKARGANS